MTLPGFTPFLAAQNTLDQLGVQAAPRNLLGMRASDMILIMSIAVMLGLALIIWAVFIRKPKEKERVYHSRPYVEERDDGTIRKRKKHRRRRRDHRQRNPTLAEVGGLPPVKTDPTPPPI
jgi:hypothetical protein